MTSKDFHNRPEHQADRDGYSDMVVSGGFAFLSGKVAADGSAPVRIGDIEDETRACMDLLAEVLALNGLKLSDVVRTNIYLTELSEFDRMNAVYRSYFAPGRMPARTTVGVAGLVEGCRIEIEAVARIPGPNA